MAKPSITKRNTKGAALTYTELDDNFQNLKDATITLTAGTGGTAVSVDLNGTLTLVAGSNITLTGNNTAKTITITSSGGGGGSQSPLTTNVDMQGYYLYDSIGNPKINDDLYFLQNNSGPVGAGTLLIRNRSANETNITLTQNEISIQGGLQFDNLSTTDRNALTASPGMVIWNTTTNKLQVYSGSAWIDLH